MFKREITKIKTIWEEIKSAFLKIKNKRRSRTAIFSVNVADKKMVEQTKNCFYTSAELDQKHVDGNLSKKTKPIA